MVRCSVSHLGLLLQNIDTGERFYPGLLWRKGLRKGIRQYSAIGGAALLTDLGLAYIGSCNGTLETEERDARFHVPCEHAIDLLELFQMRRDLCVDGLEHELLAELAGDELVEFGMSPILTPEQVRTIEVGYLGWVYMTGNPLTTPVEGRVREGDATSERLIRAYCLRADRQIVNALRRHDAIRLYTETEARRTEGGLVTGQANDGTKIGNNIISVHLLR
ncbi:MAG: hypothetical protein AAB839_00865 [Patescibacteria group bacterium]